MLTKKSKIANMVAATLTALALAGTAFIGTQAAVAANNCSFNQACLYDYDNYTGLLATKDAGDPLTNLHGYARNNTASIGNDSNYYGCAYDHWNGAGKSWKIDPRHSFAFYSPFERDRIESWKLDGTGC